MQHSVEDFVRPLIGCPHIEFEGLHFAYEDRMFVLPSS